MRISESAHATAAAEIYWMNEWMNENFDEWKIVDGAKVLSLEVEKHIDVNIDVIDILFLDDSRAAVRTSES